MELTNEFRVGVSVPEAWKVLTDVERIAPMLPGAQLQEVEGDEYRGVVKVKVGPITAQYKGQATFVERDEAAGRVVLKAAGRDTRGQGNATALISATMVPEGDGTRVSVVTDLTISGKVAQFGRGVLAEVSAKLLGQFVDALEADIAASGHTAESGEAPGDGAPAGSDASVSAPGNGAGPGTEAHPGSSAAGDGAAARAVRTISGPEAQPVDLLAVSKDSVVKRLLPLAAVAAVLVILLARRRARARRSSTPRSRRTGGLPSVSDLTGRLPSVSQVAEHLPSVTEVSGHLPSVGEWAGYLPDFRVADVQAAIRRRRH
jgi:carbon monoxide dehydrogenase subunit G